ncbi:hypothetical protein FCULG_00008723 [Fusarium culmorum]|uniref:Uncharacterized protein n=1 Tax=Fusarium culmorum TaxID=5516 RepID=A0A2T4H2C1_FUSCU|nr:hypothetical protein FCULG_00008723 [Fusarium culmorum]
MVIGERADEQRFLAYYAYATKAHRAPFNHHQAALVVVSGRGLKLREGSESGGSDVTAADQFNQQRVVARRPNEEVFSAGGHTTGSAQCFCCRLQIVAEDCILYVYQEMSRTRCHGLLIS